MFLDPNKILLSLLSNRLGRSAVKLELKPRVNILGDTLPTLTEQEKNSIVARWKTIGKNNINFDFWRFYKAFHGENVSAEFVPDNLYWSHIIRALNPISLTRTYINKSLYPIIFKGLPQPTTLINVINGVCYDGNMKIISFDKGLDILYNYDDDVIIKPTVATSGGKGVLKITSTKTVSEVKKILSNYGQNYICQALVHQSESTAAFNRSSLNTFRLNTININGRTTCECLMMRHGLNGNIVDNFALGGVVCGMSKRGEFNGNNFNIRLERLTNIHDGMPYSKLMVPGVSDVICQAVDAHQKFMPHIGHAAWDFAIDENDRPVMIEVNLMLPGIIMEQLSSAGSIFGNRLGEVLDHAVKRNSTLSWTEFVGGWG